MGFRHSLPVQPPPFFQTCGPRKSRMVCLFKGLLFEDFPDQPTPMAPHNRRIVSPDLEPASPTENFNLDDVPGNDNPDSDSGHDVGVNDPDAVPMPKTGAVDIRYFFDKTGERAVCKVCLYVAYVLAELFGCLI